MVFWLDCHIRPDSFTKYNILHLSAFLSQCIMKSPYNLTCQMVPSLTLQRSSWTSYECWHKKGLFHSSTYSRLYLRMITDCERITLCHRHHAYSHVWPCRVFKMICVHGSSWMMHTEREMMTSQGSAILPNVWDLVNTLNIVQAIVSSSHHCGGLHQSLVEWRLEVPETGRIFRNGSLVWFRIGCEVGSRSEGWLYTA